MFALPLPFPALQTAPTGTTWMWGRGRSRAWAAAPCAWPPCSCTSQVGLGLAGARLVPGLLDVQVCSLVRQANALAQDTVNRSAAGGLACP